MFVWAFLCLIVVVVAEDTTGPVGKVDLKDFQLCKTGKNVIKLKPKLVTKNGKKAGQATLTIPSEITNDNLLITVSTKKFVDGEFVASSFQVEDEPFLPFLNSYLGKIYDTAAKKFVPPIKNKSKIAAGDYKLTDFMVSCKDIATPQVPYGRFLAEAHGKLSGEEIMCVVVDIEFFKPQGPADICK